MKIIAGTFTIGEDLSTQRGVEPVSAPQKELIVFNTSRHLLVNKRCRWSSGPVIDVVTGLDGERLTKA